MTAEEQWNTRAILSTGDDAGLVEELRLHAYDDCGHQEPPPTHIAMLAAAAILSLTARNKALEEALREARTWLCPPGGPKGPPTHPITAAILKIDAILKTDDRIMTDSERLAAAHKFFWEQVGDNIVDAATAERQIRRLAEALPPFTRLNHQDNRQKEGGE